MARLAGNVHGVVVQITTASGCAGARPFAAGSATGKATQMECERLVRYSISASAKAVWQGMDQYTGFLER